METARDCYNSIILSSIEKWAELTPEKAVFTDCEGETVSYRRFFSEVKRTAAGLLTYFGGKMPEEPVAVAVGRDVRSLVAMFGVFAAGGWYLPVDGELPEERLTQLLCISKPSLFLWGTAEPLKACSFAPVMKTEELWKLAEAQGTDTGWSLPSLGKDDQPMFGIFTSGSTGLPKLVVKSRRAMEQFTRIYCRTFGFTGEEVFGNQIPFYFDASTKDIFATVLTGATTVILPAKAFSFPVNLVKLLNEYEVTSIVWVPSALATAARFNVFSAELPAKLKNILFVGEKMPVRYLNCWRNALPEANFVNLYGSTEVAGNSCYYKVDRAFGEEDILPIGVPFEGTKVFLLDEQGKPAKEGEICVAGEGLAIGYYLDPEKTAEAFRTVSIPEEAFEGRIYRSGDYGKLNEKGELVCVSRKDGQIKHMGHRIELGEIEAAVMAADYIKECCCLYNPKEEKIYLCYSAENECKKELHADLSKRLPKYMLPHKWVYLPELPHNRNGKIDRAALSLQYAGAGK